MNILFRREDNAQPDLKLLGNHIKSRFNSISDLTRKISEIKVNQAKLEFMRNIFDGPEQKLKGSDFITWTVYELSIHAFFCNTWQI